MYDLNKLVKAFEVNGIFGKDAYDAAYAYRDVDFKMDLYDQESYNNAIKEEIDCWD